jgi:hypothetical protein
MPKSHSFTRRPVLLSTIACAALALAAATYAATSASSQLQGKHEKQQKGGDDESPLEQAMQKMQANEKRLGGALAKKDLAAALPLVLEMQHAAQAAKVETPPKANDIADAAKKTEFVNGFRKGIIALQKSLCDLEIALVDGKADDATRIYEGTIKPAKKEGHAKYKGD